MFDFSDSYIKTIYACSCPKKEVFSCKNCSINNNCERDINSKGFVMSDIKVYDFDAISALYKIFPLVDSYIRHSNDSFSLLEFTSGNPRNKKTQKKCEYSIFLLKKYVEDYDSKKTDYYFIYDDRKFNRSEFERNNSNIDYDDLIFQGFMDLNAEDILKLKYFSLMKCLDLFRNVYPINSTLFNKSVEKEKNKWCVYG